MGVLKTFATGNLTADPELRYTPQGKAVCDFKVAVNLGYGEYAYTEYLRCTAWEKKGEFINQYFTKGSGIVLELQQKTESWEDKETGEKKYMVKYTVQDASFPPSSGKGNTDTDSAANTSQKPASKPTAPTKPAARNVPQSVNDEDLPF